MENGIAENLNATPIEIALGMSTDGTVSSKNVYEFLQLNPAHYARWCKSNIAENEFAEEGVDFRPFTIHGECGGQATTDYKLSVSFAKKLCMKQGNERGEQARCYFVACEQSLAKIAKERQQWEIERAKGVVIRHILTDTIKMRIADSPNKRFAYPNYTKLVYQTIFSKTVDELRSELGVKAKESIRDYLTVDQLREVESLEMLVSSLIGVGMGYAEIKDFVGQRYAARLTAVDARPVRLASTEELRRW